MSKDNARPNDSDNRETLERYLHERTVADAARDRSEKRHRWFRTGVSLGGVLITVALRALEVIPWP